MSLSSDSPRSTLSEPARRAFFLEASREAAQRLELRRRDLARGYRPRGRCRRLWKSDFPELFISGPAGTGKSRVCLEKINRLCWEYPDSRHLIVRKTRASLNEAALQTYEDYVLGPGNPISEGARREFRRNYVYPNGARIVLGGMDKATRIMSTEYDTIFVQEAIELTLDDWESLITRLRNRKTPVRQIIADTNPGAPNHWICQRCKLGHARMIQSTHEDNPLLWNAEAQTWTPEGAEYIAKLDTLTGARHQRLRFGLWVQAEGAVYPMYDPEIHEVYRFDIPPSWKRYRSIDFGYTNPFVCQWWAVDEDGRMYLYREIYMSEGLVEDFAAQIKFLSQGEEIELTVADHDAEDRATLARHGVPTVAARKAISPGLQAVQRRLRKAGDNRPRCFFLRDSLVERDIKLQRAGKPTCTADEIPAYVWSKKDEKPVDVDDHGCDSLRYMVMHLDQYGDPSDWIIKPR